MVALCREEGGEELLAAIRKHTSKPMNWVVNTHAHGDHYFGNAVFKREGATIIAHRDTAGMMKSHFPARDEAPDGDLGGRTVELLYIGPGQNPGDTFVYLPKERSW